jgi:uncharacterized protein (TIGR02996 family)
VIADGEELVIGGAGDCDIVLTDSQVEDRHLHVKLRGDVLVVHDLAAGTQLALGLDDTLVIGETSLELEAATFVPERIGEPWPAVLSQTELGLLSKLASDPANEGARAIYADWLEAEGHHLRAAFVRRPPDEDSTPNTSELFGKVAHYTEVAWRAVVGRSSIDECAIYDCPGRWHLLEPTERHDSRVCRRCGATIAYSDWAIRRRSPTNR